MVRDNRSYNRAIDDLYQLSKKYEFIDPSQNTKSNWVKLKKNADRTLLNKASRIKCSKILDQKKSPTDKQFRTVARAYNRSILLYERRKDLIYYLNNFTDY